MARDATLTAYGSEEDRDKLAVLAQQSGKTVSTWIVDKIREDYARLYGQTDPKLLRKPG